MKPFGNGKWLDARAESCPFRRAGSRWRTEPCRASSISAAELHARAASGRASSPPPSLLANMPTDRRHNAWRTLGCHFEPFSAELRSKGVLFPVELERVWTAASYSAAALDNMSIDLLE